VVGSSNALESLMATKNPDDRLVRLYGVRLKLKDAAILEHVAHLQERTPHQVIRSAVNAYLRGVLQSAEANYLTPVTEPVDAPLPHPAPAPSRPPAFSRPSKLK